MAISAGIKQASIKTKKKKYTTTIKKIKTTCVLYYTTIFPNSSVKYLICIRILSTYLIKEFQDLYQHLIEKLYMEQLPIS